MGRQSKEEKLRYEGISWAFDRIEKVGLEKAKEEFERRGALHWTMGIEEAEVLRFEKELRATCKKTMCAMVLLTLHDEFGFGHDRLVKFEKRWNLKVDCLAEDLADWPDFAQILMEECKIDIDIPVYYANNPAAAQTEGEATA